MSSSRKRSHHHNDDDSDDNEIKIIPFKKQCEEVKTIKIVRDGSPVPVSQRVLCNICNESLMSQAYLDRHMKVLHSANSLVCNDCGVVKETRKKLRDHKRIHVQCVCQKCGKSFSKMSIRQHLKFFCKGNQAKTAAVHQDKVYKCKFCTYISISVFRKLKSRAWC